MTGGGVSGGVGAESVVGMGRCQWWGWAVSVAGWGGVSGVSGGDVAASAASVAGM